MEHATRGRTRELSDGALLVEYSGASDDEANRAATALGRELAELKPPGLLDAIPGARTLLILFDPFAFERGSLEPLLVSTPERSATDAQRTVRIPVCYGGELGPDLEELSRERNLSASEFARRHRDSVYRVAFLGFAPGFAYLVGLPSELHAPRLQSPRPRVPAGSVGIGGPYTGIYPSDTPGGWMLIGNSPVRLFDPSRSPPSLLLPGDRVAFDQIAELEHQRLRESLASPVSPASQSASVLLRVLSPGLFTSVQGTPRFGLGSCGVPSGGAMDLPSLARANTVLGNDPFAPGLEVTLFGPRLEVCQDCRICVAGGEIESAIGGAPLPNGRACIVRAGAQLTLGAIRRGARAYLAIEGGIEDPWAGAVTRRLERGDTLIRAPSEAAARASWSAAIEGSGRGRTRSKGDAVEPIGTDLAGSGSRTEAQTVRVVLGPQEDYFTRAGLSAFLSTSYRVSPQSDRRGARLEGARIELARPPDIPPEGTAPGAIQVPGEGLPILLGPDRPVTGGYAKIATVIGADLPLLGQLRTGTSIRFLAVSIQDAIAARRG